MDPALLWAVIGLALVIVELLTGTLYLLILGLAAFGAAGTAWLGYDLAVQVIVASVVAGVGCYAVHVYRGNNITG
jgi:membrane protein implicated in regulation of membrane protease activity